VKSTLPAWTASFELPSGAAFGVSLPLDIDAVDREAMARKLEHIASVVREGGPKESADA
jgi:hypothetical protein